MTIVASGATTPIVPGFYPDPTVCRVGDDSTLRTRASSTSPESRSGTAGTCCAGARSGM